MHRNAQDNQEGRLLHERLTPAMIACGFADVQHCKPAVCGKILCILCIDANQKSAHARLLNRFPANRRRWLFQASRAPAPHDGRIIRERNRQPGWPIGSTERLRFPSASGFVCLCRPSCVFVDNSFHSVACGAKQGRSGQASSKETSQCDILTPTGSRDTVGSVLGQGKGSHGSG